MIHRFLLGVREFRSDLTTHFDEPDLYAYDWGREWAHRLTLRFFEPNGSDAYSWARRLTLRGQS